MGSLVIMGSTLFVATIKQQVETLRANSNRAWGFATYLASIALTLCFALYPGLWFRSVLVFLSVCVQCGTLAWYCLSYFPRVQAGLPAADAIVVAAAVLSRAWVSAMALVSHTFITPYDTSALAHSKSIFSAFAAWDGVYFVDIAGEGYRYENTHAFFPLFPLLVRWTSPLLSPVLDKNTSLLAAGWLISNVCFVLAAIYLYRLGLLLLKNESLAKRAAYFFCICPSGIFMSACYSESGMYYLERYRTAARSTSGHIYLALSALLFGLSAATRSNGILHSRTSFLLLPTIHFSHFEVLVYIAYYRLLTSPHPLRAFPRFLGYWTYTALLGVVAIGFQTLSFSAARPYFAHVAFLLANALVVVHIQVITRFLAASPPIFWAAAFVTTPDPKQPANSQVQSAVVVTHGLVLYFLVFNVVGATLFPSFYPWT
ncbi:hypothetical protein DYB30_001327 [Aphanomyces astaci]|uniref:GPI mannosyltransferase 2 n=1 Tax=Aphanomyces astaci TaxID=112090 RepID=A0A397FGY8_APHAT|nr:hypothetical protein DYB38_009870 [Aphanomyces astaci]RHY46621.1 hypothetical protein DYB30_001327 [Aphanomyces astaci]RHY60834.1 hypothetical protein DYB34_004441 [Aphanomyces astaci]RHZ04708.1 hypothetical protein DYB26_003011 [Aphanomyces astaci]RHZ32386.1 hypothetical protein DYB31_003961 [Aphanomyces astaci]